MTQEGAKPQRQSQVVEQSNHLEGSLGALHDKIDSLAGRLSSVLRVPEVPKQGEGKDRVELVLLAGTIQGYDDSVKSAISKLGDILERLEL